jgi:hypothetical protein
MRKDSLTDLSNRIATLEALLAAGRKCEPRFAFGEQPIVDPANDRRFTKRELAERRGKSTRQVSRDVASKILPPPDVRENGRDYWWLSTLQKHGT